MKDKTLVWLPSITGMEKDERKNWAVENRMPFPLLPFTLHRLALGNPLIMEVPRGFGNLLDERSMSQFGYVNYPGL